MATPASLPPNVSGSYSFLRPIGAGAYGEVWLVQTLTGDFLALKVLFRDRFPDTRSFDREFEGVLGFKPVSAEHRNLIRISHVGRSLEGSAFYYEMELADDLRRPGSIDPDAYTPRTLASILDHRRRLPAGECADIGLQLASALGFLHQRGLVHRDVKPSNVVFVRGVPKLADVGLVSAPERATSNVGTEGYAPKYGTGSVQADIYGLGKLIYESFTGLDRLFIGRTDRGRPPETVLAGYTLGLLAVTWAIVRARFL